jgi:hypothetical protein
LYVVAVSVGFALLRFFLPLAPVYAIAAAWAVTQFAASIAHRTTNDERGALASDRRARLVLASGLVLLLLLWGGFATGTEYVLRERHVADGDIAGQPADETEAASLVQRTLQPGDRVAIRYARNTPDGLALAKYSAITQYATPAPETDDPETLRAAGANFLLRSAALGPAPAGLKIAGQAGEYTLYRLTP